MDIPDNVRHHLKRLAERYLDQAVEIKAPMVLVLPETRGIDGEPMASAADKFDIRSMRPVGEALTKPDNGYRFVEWAWEDGGPRIISIDPAVVSTGGIS